MTRQRRKQLLLLSALLGLVGLLAAGGFWPGCFLIERFGVPCLACGMSRSLAALLRLDVAASLRYHPLTVPFALTLWLFFVREPLGLPEKPLRRWAVVLGVALVGFWLWRISQGPQGWAFLLPDAPSTLPESFSDFRHLFLTR